MFNMYSIPTKKNVSYAVTRSHATISGSPTQAIRSTSENESTTNHSNFDSAYEAVDTMRGRDGRNNSCPLLKIDADIQIEETACPWARH